MRHLAQDAAGGWLMPDLVFKGFLCVSSHYLILPRISSLVAQSLGVSAPTPKAQGLISGQERRFHKWFVMALRLKQISKNENPKMNPRQMAVIKSGK